MLKPDTKRITANITLGTIVTTATPLKSSTAEEPTTIMHGSVPTDPASKATIVADIDVHGVMPAGAASAPAAPHLTSCRSQRRSSKNA